MRKVRVPVAALIAISALAATKDVKAFDETGPKCDCYSWFGHHGVYEMARDLPVMICVKTDCWVEIAD
jgi:hypothetical protein